MSDPHTSRGREVPAESALAASTVTIVGTGLMGASLGMALSGRVRARVGWSRDQQTADRAVELGAVDCGTSDLAAAVRAADIVVLATPVGVIPQLAERIAPDLRTGALVMDLGSTKGRVVAALERLLPGHVQLVGGHPMCGRASSGAAHADPAIYDGCTFVLCATTRSSDDAMRRAAELARAAGATPLEMDAHEHDVCVAQVSHLNYATAVALVTEADEAAHDHPGVRALAARGFATTTFLAQGNEQMWADIMIDNREAVQAALRSLARRLDTMADAFDDATTIPDLFGGAAARRTHLLDS